MEFLSTALSGIGISVVGLCLLRSWRSWSGAAVSRVAHLTDKKLTGQVSKESIFFLLPTYLELCIYVLGYFNNRWQHWTWIPCCGRICSPWSRICHFSLPKYYKRKWGCWKNKINNRTPKYSCFTIGPS